MRYALILLALVLGSAGAAEFTAEQREALRRANMLALETKHPGGVWECVTDIKGVEITFFYSVVEEGIAESGEIIKRVQRFEVNVGGARALFELDYRQRLDGYHGMRWECNPFAFTASEKAKAELVSEAQVALAIKQMADAERRRKAKAHADFLTEQKAKADAAAAESRRRAAEDERRANEREEREIAEEARERAALDAEYAAAARAAPEARKPSAAERRRAERAAK